LLYLGRKLQHSGKNLSNIWYLVVFSHARALHAPAFLELLARKTGTLRAPALHSFGAWSKGQSPGGSLKNIINADCKRTQLSERTGKRVKDEQEQSYLFRLEVHIADGEALGGWVGRPAVLKRKGGAGSALSPAGGWLGSPAVLRRGRGGAGSAHSPAATKGRFQDCQLRPAQYSGRIGLIESRDCRGIKIICTAFFKRFRHPPPPPHTGPS
jgi:hypothetical protein